MRFVGVDSAYRNVGLVITNESGVLLERYHLVNKANNDPAGFVHWAKEAANILYAHDVVGLEGLSFGSIGRGHVLAGVYAIWQMAAVEGCQLLVVIPPLRAKQWATGSGKAKKPEMIKWAKDSTGDTEKWSEHEADALALSYIARATYNHLKGLPVPGSQLNPVQEQILQNKKGNGLAQAENKFYFKGKYYDGS